MVMKLTPQNLAELCRDTEASMVAVGGRCVEFPVDASVSDLLEWFRAEVTTMPTAFAECNENITCYVFIGIFKMLCGGRGVNIFRSSRNWLYPAMLHSLKTSEKSEKACEELVDQTWSTILYAKD
jgi:hypothetical protein